MTLSFAARNTTIAVVTLAMTASGCASILSGSHQKLELSVQPPGTEVSAYRWTGERMVGPVTSPGSIEVHRPAEMEPYLLVASRANSCPMYWSTSAEENPITYGNLILGGVVGLLIDSSTGAGWSVVPATISGNLANDGECP